MVSDRTRLTRAALLLALALLFQSLRFVIPFPVFTTTFIIGSLVNSCLLLATEITGLRGAIMISFIVPLIAYFQQMLPIPVFILPVAISNILYCSFFYLGTKWKTWQRILVAAIVKTLFLYSAFVWLLSFVEISPIIATGILFVMSWPQIITSIIGALLATIINNKLKLINY